MTLIVVMLAVVILLQLVQFLMLAGIIIAETQKTVTARKRNEATPARNPWALR